MVEVIVMTKTLAHFHGLRDTGGRGPRSMLGRLGRLAAILACVAALPGLAEAASSKGCTGGGFRVSVPGQTVSAEGDHAIPAARLSGATQIQVIGKYVQFTIVAQSFGIQNYLFTGAANPLDMTGGRRTVVWQSKTPDHRGLVLTGNASLELDEEEFAMERSGPGLTMKIQAKDCAQGGIFQMEVERRDGTTTRFTHLLAEGAFYFDNPNFRAREGDVLPYKDTTVTVTPRINVATDLAPRLVGRDSAQVATRVAHPTCANQIRRRNATFDVVRHCGRLSQWDVASGGRMGWVTGEDAVEVAPPATDCVSDCQAQNRVRGQAVVLGFPSPVPAASRLRPALP